MNIKPMNVKPIPNSQTLRTASPDPYGFDKAAKTFAAVQATPRMTGRVPEGIYIVRVICTTLKISATSGNGRLEWVLKIEEGEYAGETLIKSSSWHTDTSLSITLTDIAVCGVSLTGAQIGYLGSHHKDLEGLLLQVQYTPKETGPTIYFQTLVDEYEDSADSDPYTYYPQN